MTMKALTPNKTWRRLRLAALSGGLALGTFLAGFASVPGASVAAPNVAPQNTGEPAITGTPAVGQILRSSNGSWSGTTPMTFAFRWVRCDASGSLPDGSDCPRISGATERAYEVRRADVGFRLRVRVTATNADGSATAASNPTAVVQEAKPVNTDRPSISGSAVVGNRLQANRGSWTGEQPITYSFRWLRCNQQGDNCGEISGATDNDYLLVDADLGRTLSVRVTARNDHGTTSAVSPQTAVIQKSAPSAGSSIPVTEVPNTARLIVSEVRFTPNPVTSRTAPITARVGVKDTRGFVIRGALVFMRATPRVTSGARVETQADGWATFQLVPNANFPQPRNGYNVQFFVKAFRAGDPPLGGIAGYRLVQVRLAR